MFVMRLDAIILENVLLLWTEEMKQMLGFSWHPAEEKCSFHLNRQVNAKSKRNIGQSGVCVCSQQEDSTCAPKTGGCVWLWHWSLHRAVHQQAWP